MLKSAWNRISTHTYTICPHHHELYLIRLNCMLLCFVPACGTIVVESLALLLYRVSIKSFPDYKHLLQDNNVEYKHFLPLLKLVSKILCNVFIVMLHLHNLLVSRCFVVSRNKITGYGLDVLHATKGAYVEVY